jgi:hypothetical protein
MVGKDATAGVAKLEALTKPVHGQTKGVFQEARERAQLAVKCGVDPLCYGKVLVDEGAKLSEREKAAIMVGILPEGRKALPQLVKALTTTKFREPVLRKYALASAARIGVARDKRLVGVVAELSEKDSKRKISFLGADLATDDKLALAAIMRR